MKKYEFENRKKSKQIASFGILELPKLQCTTQNRKFSSPIFLSKKNLLLGTAIKEIRDVVIEKDDIQRGEISKQKTILKTFAFGRKEEN